ncbi:MAG: transglutaminase-like domain-containing protein [Bacteroidota bacterium]
MTDLKNVPFLLDLLDDDSQVVQTEVRDALKKLGPVFKTAISPLWSEMSPLQKQHLEQLWQEIKEDTFAIYWEQWLKEEDEALALEYALYALSILESKIEDPDMRRLLDELAEEFQLLYTGEEVPLLMRFLFRTKGFRAPLKEYYHPRNSNLVHVLLYKEGLQISLSSLVIMLGRRLGIPIRGFNMPGHFMVMGETREGTRVFDVFNQGIALHPKSVEQLSKAMELPGSALDRLRAQTHEIVLRVLRNIIKAHERKGNTDAALMYKRHFEALLERVRREDD